VGLTVWKTGASRELEVNAERFGQLIQRETHRVILDGE
jgi:hypothetical protein